MHKGVYESSLTGEPRLLSMFSIPQLITQTFHSNTATYVYNFIFITVLMVWPLLWDVICTLSTLLSDIYRHKSKASDVCCSDTVLPLLMS